MSRQTISDSFAHISRPDGTIINVFALADTDVARGVALAEAVTLATAGDTIFINANATVTTNLAKNGVNWYFAPGVTITRSANSTGFIFDDLGAAVSFNVAGRGSFTRSLGSTSATVTDFSNTGVLKLSHASSVVHFEFDSVLVTIPVENTLGTIQEMAIFYVGNGKLIASGKSAKVNCGSTASAGYVTFRSAGELNLDCDEITESNVVNGTQNTMFEDADNGTSAGATRIRAINVVADVTNTDSYVTFSDGSNTKAYILLEAERITGHLGFDGGTQIVKCLRLNGMIGQVTGASYGNLYVTADEVGGDMFASNTAAYVNPGPSCTGFVYLNIKRFAPGANAGECVNIASGTVYLSALDITGPTGKDAVIVSGGTLNLLSGIVTKAVGKTSLKRTGGTLAVNSAVVFTTADTSGTITKLNQYGAAAP